MVLIHSGHKFRKINKPSWHWNMKYQHGTGFLMCLIRHISILLLHIAYKILKFISLYYSYPDSQNGLDR